MRMTSQQPVYADPTLERAQALEISDKGCRVCVRRVTLSGGAVRCRLGKTFPRCRGARNGFQLDVGDE